MNTRSKNEVIVKLGSNPINEPLILIVNWQACFFLNQFHQVTDTLMRKFVDIKSPGS